MYVLSSVFVISSLVEMGREMSGHKYIFQSIIDIVFVWALHTDILVLAEPCRLRHSPATQLEHSLCVQ